MPNAAYQPLRYDIGDHEGGQKERLGKMEDAVSPIPGPARERGDPMA